MGRKGVIISTGVLISLALAVSAKYEDWPPEIVKLIKDEDLLNWKPNPLLVNNYKYYLSGFDEQKKPVWVLELGKWNIRKIVEKNLAKDFDRYVDQMSANLAKSLADVTADGEPFSPGLSLIIDTEGFTTEQMTSADTISLIIKLFRAAFPVIDKLASQAYVINAHFVVMNMISLLRPYLGDALDEDHLFGPDKARWLPVLIRNIPRDALPAAYGGRKSHKPVQVFG